MEAGGDELYKEDLEIMDDQGFQKTNQEQILLLVAGKVQVKKLGFLMQQGSIA